MATIRCPNGHEISEEGNFCPVCGVRVRDEQATPQGEQAPPATTAVAATPIPRRSFRARWSSLGRKTKVAIIVGVVLLGLVLVGAVLSDSNSSNETSAPVSSVRDRDGFRCPSNETKFGLCPSSPYFGKTPAAARIARHQAAVSLAAARRKAARHARAEARAEAREQARAEARAEARARARAARIAAANAWHKGYNQQDGSVYWKWVEGRSCQDFALNGCWHVEVITQDGCSSYVAVNANEYQGGTIVNQLLDNQGYGIPPKTPRVFELDSDTSGNATAGDVTIDCT